MIKVECPSCSAPYELDEKRLPASGLRMRCPKCGASFQVAPDGSVGEPQASVRPKKRTQLGMGVAPPPSGPPPGTSKLSGGGSKLGAAGSATAKFLAEMGDDVDLPAPKGAIPAKPSIPKPAIPKPAIPKPAIPKPAIAKPAIPRPKAPPPPPPPPGEIDLPAAVKRPQQPTGIPKIPKPSIPKPPAMNVDLPTPVKRKKPLAPPMPTPPMPTATSGPSELDLPAPKKKRPLAPPMPPGPSDLDLPTPKRAAAKRPAAKRPAAKKPDLDGLDLPVPVGTAVPVGTGAPKRKAAKPPVVPEFDLDLPTPKASGGFDDLDLPPSRGSTPFDDMMSDLPAPMSQEAGELDLDLPMPKGGDVDLPMPKGGELDLPMPKGGGGFGDLDLPMPKATQGGLDLDLPMPSGGVDLPMPSGGVDLPMRSDGLDLPIPSTGVDLPIPSTGVDLPIPSQGVDLPVRSDGLDLPISSSGLDAPRAKTDLDLLLPTDDDGLGLGEDDLSLPQPRDRGAPGGPGFGEIDLGGDGEPRDSLEFDDIPEEQGGDVDLDAVGGMDLPEDAADPTKGPVRDPSLRPPKKSRGIWYLMGALVVVVAAGVGLRWTPYGIFGVHFFEGFRSAAGDDATIDGIITEAETMAAADTYDGIRSSVRRLSEARNEYYLNRELLARSALHEALFQVRFGTNPRAEGRERTILDRLKTRGDDAPGFFLAKAASELRQELPSAGATLAGARSESASDPYFSLVAAEIAFAAEDWQTAATEFQAAADAGAGARGLWGVARAKRNLGDNEGFHAAAVATLAASPSHAGALVATGEVAFIAGENDQALQLGQQASSSNASGAEKAAAFGLVGRVYEARGRRGQARQAYENAVAASPFDHESLLGLGRVLLEERRFGDALARFQGAQGTVGDRVAPEGVQPYDIQIGIGMTRAHIALNEPEQAYGIMQGLAEVHPENTDVILWLGKSFEARAQFREAIAQYERAIALDPTRFDGYLAAAQLHFARDQPTEAGQVLERARTRVEVTSEVRRLLGESELRRYRLPQAIAEFRGALGLDPENTHALYGLAQSQRRAGNLTEANAVLERLGAIDSTYPGLALERGRVYEAQGNPERAVRLYERALATSPDDMALVLRLGAAQVAADMVDEAEVTIRRVLEAEPQNAEALHFMGRVAFERGQYQSAQEQLSRAIALDPATGEYHMWMAWTFLEQNNLSRALEEVSRSLEIDESLGEAYYVRGRIGLRGGAVRDAAVDFERALQLRPSLSEALAGLGECYDQLGDRNEAIASYERAVAREADNGEWQYRLGKLRQEAGRGGEALAALTRATQVGDDYVDPPVWLADAHRLRGEAHRRGGERGAAIQAYERYLELAPQGAIDREEVRRTLDRLR